MKRELKALFIGIVDTSLCRFTHHPDEEGTERHGDPDVPVSRLRFTHHPDEEGTERQAALLR